MPASTGASLSASPALAHRRISLFWAALIVVTFLQLNLQKVLYLLLGLEPGQIWQAPYLASWVVLPLLLWLWSGPRFALRFWRLPLAEQSLLLWSALLLAHAVVFSLLNGPTAGVLAFLSWGAWVGLYFWIIAQRSHRIPLFFAWLFVGAGVLNAAPVLYETLSGEVLIKVATVSEVVRSYGVNQSVSTLGLQLAIGSLAAMYLLIEATGRGRILPALLCALQVMALFASTARAPFLFFLVASAFILTFSGSTARRRLGILVGTGVLILAIFVSMANDHSGLQAYAAYLEDAFLTTDAGNVQRLSLYAEAVVTLSTDIDMLLWGAGAGRMSQVARFLGNGEYDVESSAIKLLMEVGFAGFLLFAIGLAAILKRGLYAIRSAHNSAAVIFTAILLVIVLDSFIHEALKAWVGAFYLWATLGVLSHVKIMNALKRAGGRRSGGRPNG